jgi:DNA-binding SARP family transcriptional activator
MASQSLRQAIHRLRSLLGEDKTIETGGGRVSLNQNHVWVDSIAFEYLSKTAREAWHDGHCLPKAVTLLEQAVALYADHFFVPDAAETHAVKQRESLRRLFIGNVEILGAAYMELRQWDKGAALYERGLEIDELIETFYLNLMRCHLEQNRRDMAVAAYNRCKHQLNSAFGFGPSEQMEALYRLMKS